MSERSSRGVRRRELLTGGLAAGAGALLLGGTTGVSAVAAGRPSRDGPMGDGGAAPSRPLSEDPSGLMLPQAIPAQIAGAQMMGIYGTSFSTFGYNPTDQASVLYVGGKGAHVSGAGARLHAWIPLRPGSRIVRLDYFGFRDADGTQTWWLMLFDPSTFAVSALTADVASGIGAIGATRVLDELVLPGYEYAVMANSTSGDPYVRGAIVQFTPPAGDFYPISPKRVYDSRLSGGRLNNALERTLSVAIELGTANVVVPSGARAVAVNLTIDQTAGAGYLSIRPAATAWDGTSSINWSGAGATIANGASSLVGGDRQVTVRCGGTVDASTHFLIDVVGYYL